ncbi:uncharacterized protein LOC123876365 isoform X1 [Maniola jurtina]|uniref:uncharacterized protein LOC123876365 isoform X1 n=1 Tax=Maniola jurtina TaxID=191418 RepID=UPI001E68BFD7|nr:uncharacterized protein LOC123876365 isoform X1 [Maniola jurtina]
MNTSERASHPSRAQIESLLEYLQRNPSLAKGFSKVPSARNATRRSWEALALQLNSLGGCVKTSKQWIKTTASTSQAVEQAPGDQSISLLGSQLLEIDALPQTEDHHIYRSTPSTLSDSAISTRVVQGTLPVTPSAHP